MVSRLGAGEYIVEEMDGRNHVVEILVGGRQDENFGPIVMVGAGGTETELYNDTRLELAPVSRAEAHDMLTQLTCYRLLQGWRGRPAADVESLVDVVVSVSRLIAANNEIAEVEINPVRVAESGAIAVDALVLTATGDDAEATGEDAEAGSEDAASTAAAPVHRTNDVSEEMRA